jgi:Protein of unknown function, DUF547
LNRHPYQKNDFRNYLEDGDERASLALSSLDPRIHFVLNCGAKSCPPIKIVPEDPEEALSLASAAYLASEISIDIETKTLYLPKLAFWYQADFGENPIGAFLRILGLVPVDYRNSIEEKLLSLVGCNINLSNFPEGFPSGLSVVYNEYDWASNEDLCDS